MQKITPFLWYDSNAEEAANYYVSVFKNSKIHTVSRYGKSSSQASGRPEGSVMTVDFELDGERFTAINGGSYFKLTPAVSFMVSCKNQEEIDYYWSKLSAVPEAEQCGWLQDKFGLSWQIVPDFIMDVHDDPKKSEKVMAALLPMKKLDYAKLKEAAEKA